jgi:hypothetical protein
MLFLKELGYRVIKCVKDKRHLEGGGGNYQMCRTNAIKVSTY